MKFVIHLIGSGLGTGYSPFASGTAGSLAALLIWIALPTLQPWQQIALIAITFLIGIPICTKMEAQYGHDPKEATFDEFVGQWISLLFLPKTVPIYVASFLIFRVLDVWKPFPARVSQKLPRGWGIMIDDVIAGGYTCAIVHLARGLIH